MSPGFKEIFHNSMVYLLSLMILSHLMTGSGPRDRAEVCCLWASKHFQGGVYKFNYISLYPNCFKARVVLTEQSPLNSCKHNPDV